MHLVIVAYEFPPANTGGSHRSYRFFKILPDYNVRVTVVTVNESEYLKCGIFQEASIPNFKQGPSRVIRTKIKPKGIFSSFFSSYYFNIIDSVGSRWFASLMGAIESINKEDSIDVILATLPPFSLAKYAVRISERLNIPLILDFRDAWSQWNIAPYASYIHYHLVKRLERKCIRAAKAVIATSNQTIEDFKITHPGIPESKYYLITNCYEGRPKGFCNIKEDESKKIVIGYVGSFYYEPHTQRLLDRNWWQKLPYQYFQFVPKRENWLYRTPYYFFLALKKIFEAAPELQQRVEIRFAGKRYPWLEEMARKTNLSKQFIHVGQISKDDSLKFQQDCDALLITSSKVIGGRDYSIAGKTFEYLTMGKPIIAFTPEGAQKDLLKSTGIALMCDPDDPDDSAEKLFALLTGKVQLKPNYSEIEKYSCTETIKRLAGLIHGIASKRQL